jgi:hypothetical protein
VASIYAIACTNNTGIAAVDAQGVKWIEVLPARVKGSVPSILFKLELILFIHFGHFFGMVKPAGRV